MRFKTIVAGAAIALAATVGSAYAAERFATLEGVSAQPMSSAEIDSVRGQGGTLHLILDLFDCGCSAPTRHTHIENNENAPTGNLTVHVVGNHEGGGLPQDSSRHGAHVAPGEHTPNGHSVP